MENGWMENGLRWCGKWMWRVDLKSGAVPDLIIVSLRAVWEIIRQLYVLMRMKFWLLCFACFYVSFDLCFCFFFYNCVGFTLIYMSVQSGFKAAIFSINSILFYLKNFSRIASCYATPLNRHHIIRLGTKQHNNKIPFFSHIVTHNFAVGPLLCCLVVQSPADFFSPSWMSLLTVLCEQLVYRAND